ncbi:hypothetical protein PTUN_a2204 [Pseudoalteromonas tunicata]|nr:hypothetical protein PTUN_a2204 [Pseudoalteromonas tunicata]
MVKMFSSEKKAACLGYEKTTILKNSSNQYEQQLQFYG